MIHYGTWRQLARNRAQCGGAVFTVQFIRKGDPETPKMAEPYLQSQIWWQILNREARIPIWVSEQRYVYLA